MRGEIWVARADLYATKVRPVLIIQADDYDAYESTVTCLFTSVENRNDIARVRIEPDADNSLDTVSFVMTDKIFSFDKNDLDKPIGRLSDADMKRVSEKLRAILGI
ncbi:MAG: type II toxin-antitoxin system PemK/MazF family toxin [Clostridiales Family XIII bacterium]|jgi:mRNA interferase MazF|nr:type II toxin-antitoxin system PemK/MazF family toxin [Clostridiales Family XIII bacterium]